VTGRVRLGNDAPVTFGTLTFSLANGSTFQLSDLSGGTFSLPIVPPGTYTMAVNANGRTTSVGFTVAPNAVTPVDLRLPALATVRVQVNNPGGGQAPNPRVTIAYPGNAQFKDGSASGLVTFSDVREGEYTVYARQNAELGERNVTVTGVVAPTDEGKTIDVTAELKALVTLRITVTRAGAPVSHLPVVLKHSEDDSFRGLGLTNAQGQVMAEDIPSGAYEVRVRGTHGNVAIGSAEGTIPQSADGSVIDIPVDLTTDTVTLSGRLLAGDGQTQLRNYQAWVRVFDGDREVGDYVDNNGVYYFSDVPRPESGSLSLRVHFGEEDSRSIEEAIAVGSGSEVTHDVTLPVSAVTGRVMSWDGSVLEGAGITLQTEDSDEFYTDSDDEGRFALFDVPAGQFTLWSWTNSGTYSATIGTLSGPAAVTNVDIVYGRITGKVNYANGSPTPNPAVFARQTLRPNFTVTYDPQWTAADGSFEIIGPSPGAVTIEAQKFMLEGRADSSVPAVPATVDVEVPIEAGGVVVATVVDGADTPLPNVAVALAIDGLNRTGNTDASGTVRFEHVKFGAFKVQAQIGTDEQARFVAVSGTLTSDPQTGVVTLRVPATGELSGQVVSSGAGAANAEVLIENVEHSGPLGGFSRALDANSTGFFSATDVPAGQVRVSAFSGIFGGSRTITLTPGTPATVEVQIGSLVKLADPYALSSSAFRFSVGCRGYMANGGRIDGSWSTMYADAFGLTVNDTSFPCLPAAALEDGQRELVLDGGVVGTIRATRKIYVSETGDYARYLEILTNSSASPRTVTVDVAGGLSSWPSVPAWVVRPEATGMTHAVSSFLHMGSLGFAFAGHGATLKPTEVYVDSPNYFFYRWEVTVPANGTVILVHFAQQDSSSTAATAHAEEFAATSRSGMWNGMSAQERAQVVNFKLQ
jgi:hypothetical protein